MRAGAFAGHQDLQIDHHVEADAAPVQIVIGGVFKDQNPAFGIAHIGGFDRRVQERVQRIPGPDMPRFRQAFAAMAGTLPEGADMGRVHVAVKLIGHCLSIPPLVFIPRCAFWTIGAAQ